MKICVSKNMPGAAACFLRAGCNKLLLLFLFIIGAMEAHAQSTANYSFATNTSSALIDISSGSSILVAANTDDGVSTTRNIGFDFWFQGQRYTRFSVNSNGLMRLGGTVVQPGNPYKPLAQAGMALITAYGADQRVHTSGKVHYKLSGVAPNRVLVVEWLHMQADFNAGGTSDLTYQARLYETTGVVEHVYGTMTMSAAGASDENSGDPHIGFSSGNIVNTVGSVTAPQPGTPAPSYDGGSAIPVANLYTEGTIAALSTAIEGSRRMLQYIPAIPADPTGLNFTATGIGSMTLNWTDNAINENGYVIYRSTDGTSYSFVNQVPGAAGSGTIISSAQTGLNGSTLYYWKIYAVTEGALSTSLDGSQSTLTCSVPAGTYTVGPTGNYLSLTDALANLNANGLAGPVILELQTTYLSLVETFPITINAIPCAGPVNTLTIRPEAGALALSLTSTNTVATMEINGGNYIIIDGRPGGTGTSKQLSIINTSTVTGGAALRFINEGSNNIIHYAVLKGTFPSAAAGVVVFGTTTGANGNDNNTIDNCDIDGSANGAASPTMAAQNGIYSLGTAAAAQNNGGNIISNSNIFNNFATGATTTSAGILLLAGNTNWTINANSIYQTGPRTSLAAATVYGISIANPASGNNFVVSNNFIGGSAPGNGGAAWTVNGNFSNRFNGIGLSVDSNSVSSIQGNTISNFAFTSSSTATANSGSSPLGTGIWGGIAVAAGNVNIGTVTGNTIGAATGNGSITVTGRNPGGTVNGIGISGDDNIVIANNNIIGSITTTGSTAGISTGIIGIQTASSGYATINANTIGSTVTANSFNASNPSTSVTPQIVTGIKNTGNANAISITNNIIANFNDAYSPSTLSTARVMAGIVSSAGINTITGNTIRHLGTGANAGGTGAASSVIGISLDSGAVEISNVSQNTVHALCNTNATMATTVTGIHYAGAETSGNLVARNNIYNLAASTTNTAADIRGINFSMGHAAIENNFIRLGYDTSGMAMTNGIPITGLYEVAGSGGSAVYFNSIYLGGTGVGTEAGNTYALRTDQLTGTRIIQDNIFMNARSNAGGGGKHYAIRAAGTSPNPAGLVLNYNDYFVPGTGGVLGFFNSLDVADLAAWKIFVGADMNSISGDPHFINATAAIPDLHINAAVPSPVESAGLIIAEVVNDFDGQTRSTFSPADMGADAGDYILGDISAPSISYTTLPVTCATGDRVITATITDALGLPTLGVFMPRIYYRKNAGAYFSSAGVLSSGTAINGNWTFTIVAADMGGVTSPDIISYFIIAQDIAAVPNITSSPATGLVATDVNTVVVPPTIAHTYAIKSTLVAGTYSVGSAGIYTTLTQAVAAYNTSCIAGAIVFELLDAGYPNETFPVTINANTDAGITNTLKIRPAAGVSSTITGSATKALIILNGADHITIDGSNNSVPNTICPLINASRNLTIINTNASTASAVVWLQSTPDSNSVTHNAIRNCNISGSVNTATLIGIGSGSSSISTRSLGLGNSNNIFENNNIKAVQVGIYSQGASFEIKNEGNRINQNLMNTPSGSGQNIRIAGILVGFEDDISISGNTIASVIGSPADGFGIACGDIAVSNFSYSADEVTNATINYNKIDSIRSAPTYSVSGIYITTARNPGINTIANNTISNIATNGTLGDFGSGIFIGGGILNTHIHFNSVSMSGTFTGGSEPNFALAIGGVNTSVNIRNNILSARAVTGSATTTGLGEYAIGFAYDVFNSLDATRNDHFTSGPEAKFAKIGSLAAGKGTDIANIAALRTATGEDVNSISADPLFNSLSNLRPQPGSPLIALGAPEGGITNDILCVTRHSTTPSTGAYENAIDVSAPQISYTALSGTCSIADRIVTATITDVSGIPTSGPFRPRIYFRKNAGAYISSPGVLVSGTADNAVWNFTISVSELGGVINPDVISYFIIAQDIAVITNIGSDPSAGLVITAPTVPAAYLIQNTLAAGTYYVGAGGNYPTLTAAINAYNTSCPGGPVIFELMDAAFNEAAAMTIMANAGASAVNTLTIRPAAGITSIVSASVANGPVLKILGKHISIDGSNNGSASRNLTITNSNTTVPNVIWIGSTGSTAVTHVTVKNTVIINGVNTASAIFVCDGSLAGIPGYFNNISLQNNSIQKAYIGINAIAVSLAGNGNALNIISNDLSATAATAISYIGIYVEGVDGATIKNNTIGNIDGTNDENDKCIWLANGTINSSATANKLFTLNYSGTGGHGCHGIYVSTATEAANTLVANNEIAGLSGDGWNYQSPFLLDNPMGIALVGTQSGINVYFNSISLSGSALNQNAAMSMGIYLDSGTVANIRDNIIANNLGLTAARGYGSVGVYAVKANNQFTAIDHNDYYINAAGAGNKFLGQVAGVGASTLAEWRTVTAQDANSISVDPLFTGTTNLALTASSPVIAAGISIGGITSDITASTRNIPPSMGAYEDKLVFSARIFLQGAYDPVVTRHKNVSTNWATVMNASALTQPYSAAPFNYSGTESVSAGFFVETAATTDITDWVLLELRDAAAPTTIMARRAAFVREDGMIVDLDGISNVAFKGVSAGNYFVVIRHRNHLGVRSGTIQHIDGSTAPITTYDFTSAQSQALQDAAITTNAAMAENAGVFMLWGGNVNQDIYVRATTQTLPPPLKPSDAAAILVILGNNTNATGGYTAGDVNLDGYTRATTQTLPPPLKPSDAAAILVILGNNTNATRTEHKVNN